MNFRKKNIQKSEHVAIENRNIFLDIRFWTKHVRINRQNDQ